MSMGNYWGNAVLNFMVNNRTVWFSLHESNPGPDGSPSTEVSGGDYERLEGSFTVPSSKAVATDVVLEWNNMPACNVSHAGVWDAEFGGHIIAYGEFSSLYHVLDGQQFVLEAGEFAIAL